MTRFDTDKRLRSLISGPRKFATYEFPVPPPAEGEEEVIFPIAIRALTEDEFDAAKLSAQKWYLDKCKARRWEPAVAAAIDSSLLERELQRQLLFRAVYDVDTVDQPGVAPTPFFSSVDDIRTLDSITMHRLSQVYLEHQEHSNPLLQLSEEEVKEVVASLKKGRGPRAVLARFDADTLRRCVLSMASPPST